MPAISSPFVRGNKHWKHGVSILQEVHDKSTLGPSVANLDIGSIDDDTEFHKVICPSPRQILPNCNTSHCWGDTWK